MLTLLLICVLLLVLLIYCARKGIILFLDQAYMEEREQAAQELGTPYWAFPKFEMTKRYYVYFAIAIIAEIGIVYILDYLNLLP